MYRCLRYEDPYMLGYNPPEEIDFKVRDERALYFQQRLEYVTGVPARIMCGKWSDYHK